MPDLHETDLDRAFAALTSDLTTRSSAPGAVAAIATARARRRTRSGVVALVAAAAVAAVAVPQVLGDGDDGSVAGRADLPAAVALSPALLSAATGGWTGAWEDMDEPNANLEGVDANCLDGVGGPDAQPKRLGDRVFVSDREEVAVAIFVDYDGRPAAVDGYAAAFGDGMGSCGAQISESTHGDAVVTHGSASGGSGTDIDEVWFARLGDRVALFAVLGATSPAPDDATDALTDLVLGAIQDNSSFEVSSGLLELQTDTGSSRATPSSFRDIPLARIREATGDWSRGWTNASSDELTNLPCFPASWPRTSSWGQGSTIGDRGTLFYAGTSEAAAEVPRFVEGLTGCSSTRWTTHAGAGARGTAAWASSDIGSIFVAEWDDAVATLQVRGLDPPSDETAERLIGLLEKSLAHPTS